MRTFFAAALASLCACSFTPDVSSLKPKSSSDCPGQKACGYRCVALDDPSVGCSASACTPCPTGPTGTVAVCAASGVCGVQCASGLAAADGDPNHGCAASVDAFDASIPSDASDASIASDASDASIPSDASDASVPSDPENCGTQGHACEEGQACNNGLCDTGTAVASTGAAPRGLALTPTAYVWATDPPVAGGVTPKGALHYLGFKSGAQQVDVSGLGHASWVRATTGTEMVAVGGTSDIDGPMAWLVDPTQSPATMSNLGGGQGSYATLVGLELTPNWFVSAIRYPPSGGGLIDVESYSGSSLGINSGDDTFYSLGAGAGFLWTGERTGVDRLAGDAANYFDIVYGGGIDFSTLSTAPRPDRVTARATTGADAEAALEVYFADMTDGSIWTGRTTGYPNTTPPWRVVHGAGAKTQMDIAADDEGVVWSDYDKGEIWALPQGGSPYLLATGRPWAITLTSTRVYWTDVDAKAIRWVAR